MCAWKTRTFGVCVRPSATRIVPSCEPAARRVPSGLHATDQTDPRSAGRAKTSRPLAASQTLAVPSEAGRCQVRTVRTPGQRANQPELLRDSAFIMSLEGKNLFACGRIPDPNLAIIAARGQTLAVRAPRHRCRPHDMSRQHARLLIADRGPDSNAAVISPRSQAAVRAPCQGSNGITMSTQREFLAARGRVPDLDRLVDASGRQSFPIWLPRDRRDLVGVPERAEDHLFRGDIPNPVVKSKLVEASRVPSGLHARAWI